MKTEIHEGWDSVWSIDDTTPVGDDNDVIANDDDPMALALVKILGAYSLVQARVGFQRITATIKEAAADIVAVAKRRSSETFTFKRRWRNNEPDRSVPEE